MNNIYDCLIIGAGPSGIGCALNLIKETSNIAIIEKSAPGGKVNIAPRVDNYPGEQKIPGPDLAYKFFERMNNAKVPFINEEVISLTKVDDLFNVITNKNTYVSKTVYLASGTLERKLGLDKEDKLLGHGVSYCAICDGHFFVGENVLVCGGGNSALKEAIYLSNIVQHLYLIHRRNEFRGHENLVKELMEKDNVTILTPYVPIEILGEDKVTGVLIKNVQTEQLIEICVSGFFPLVGQIPSTSFINIDNVKDEYNLVPVDNKHMTNCSGLFAGGDILPREIRQIYLAEHDGIVSSKFILEYLNNGK